MVKQLAQSKHIPEPRFKSRFTWVRHLHISHSCLIGISDFTRPQRTLINVFPQKPSSTCPDTQDKTPRVIIFGFLSPPSPTPNPGSPLPKYIPSLSPSQQLPCLHHVSLSLIRTTRQPPRQAPGLHTNASLISSPYDSHTVFLKDQANDIGTQLKTLQHTTPHPCQGLGAGQALSV